MLNVGELLKNKRKDQGVKLSQASESTKIPKKLLKALEDDDFSQFASEVYLKGLLKNYAQFLKIDSKKVLAIYRRERRDQQETTFDRSGEPLKEQKPLVTPGRIVFAVTFIVVLVVIIFVATQINKIIQPPYLELIEPTTAFTNEEAFLEVDSDTITISGKVEVGSKLLINGNEVVTNNLQEFRVDSYPLNPGSNEIFIVAQSYYFSKTSEIKITVLSNVAQVPDENTESEESQDEDQEEPDEIPEGEGGMEISIQVGPEDAWVVATVDGITKVSEVVEPGKSFIFSANESFTIYSPRSQMVELTINGEQYSFGSQTAAIFKIVDGNVVQE